MNEVLEQAFRHNLWANLRVIELLEGLPEDKITATAPGTYGSPADTIVHVLSAENRYLARLTGTEPKESLSERVEFPGFGVLREEATRTGEGLLEVAAGLSEDAEIKTHFGGRDWVMKPSVILIQMLHHGNDHRSQILTVLSQNGVEVPMLDGWSFGEEAGLLKSL